MNKKIKTNLFDKNGVEIQIGDKYINPDFPENFYTVFWKGGAICGGSYFSDAEPLCWEIDVYNTNSKDEPYCLNYSEELNWLEIIKKEEDNEKTN